MKNKTLKTVLILLLMIIAVFGLSTNVDALVAFPSGIRYDASNYTDEPYKVPLANGLRAYCINNNWHVMPEGYDTVSWYAQYSKGPTTYLNDLQNNKDYAKVAYAVYRVPNDHAQIQQLIWNSNLNGGYSNGRAFVETEAEAYYDFMVAIKDGFKMTDDTVYEDLKVYINNTSTDKSYVIGPYKMTLPAGVSSAVNSGYPFCQLTKFGIKNDQNQDITELGATILNKAGKEVKVPNSNEEFYIKVKVPAGTNNVTNNIQVIKPYFNFHYIKNLNAAFAKYNGTTYFTYRVWNGEDEEGNDLGYSYYNSSFSSQPVIVPQVDPTWEDKEIVMEPVDVTMELGGTVWEDKIASKESTVDGILNNDDKPKKGVEVILHYADANGEIVKDVKGVEQKTVTDENGKYSFKNLNPFRKYYVEFIYNGQYYQHTYYENNLTGGYSNATENSRDREEVLNRRFKEIGSSPNNYKVGVKLYKEVGSWNRAYGYNTKIRTLTGEIYKVAEEEITFSSLYEELENLAVENKSYTKAYEIMHSKYASVIDIESILQYIEDSRIHAYTGASGNTSLVTYPIYDHFVTEDVHSTLFGKQYSGIYHKDSDQRKIDFGVNKREEVDLSLINDIYKATLKVNGKKEDYLYNARGTDESSEYWEITARAADMINFYTREIRKSDYLYDEELSYGSGNSYKNLRVFVTYKLAIRNQSQTTLAKIDEIVDYYDTAEYEINDLTKKESYIGDSNGNKIADLTISDTSKYGADTQSKLDGYTAIYITGADGIKGEGKADSNKISAGERAFAYVTFEVKKTWDSINELDNRIRLDEELEYSSNIGKRNIAEINGYETYYRDGASVPDKRNGGNLSTTAKNSSNVMGVVDLDSNVGNLENRDIDTTNGDILKDRLEDDTDKSRNIKIVISKDDDERVIEGYAWEDERNKTSKDAVIGDGIRQDNETKINGVTVELVELVREVDENGDPVKEVNANGEVVSPNKYVGEYVWSKNIITSGKNVDRTDVIRYYTGQSGDIKPIISGNGIFNIPDYTLNGEQGKYKFKSFPAGDYIIRFHYGDTEKTILTNDYNNEVNKILGIDGNTNENSRGLNAKSYNGQDFKTTSYQSQIDQSGSYGIVKGYTNYDVQNGQLSYSNIDLSKLYYYDVNKSDAVLASDAKDIYERRQAVIDYSKDDLRNLKAEVLACATQRPTYNIVGNNKEAIDTTGLYSKADMNMLFVELKNKTNMLANTGIIPMEVEKATTTTKNQNKENKTPYTISNVDLGLEERPEAQVKLNNEISNIKVTLSDGTEQFNANKTVKDLAWQDHTEHKQEYVEYDDKSRLSRVIRNSEANPLEELTQVILDEELMHGANIQITYSIRVDNVGDVDYNDKAFYYVGKAPSDNSNIVKTNVNKVVDYVSNLIQYKPEQQTSANTWNIVQANDLANVANDNLYSVANNNNYVNQALRSTLDTYNMMLTTNALSADLIPQIVDETNDKANSSKTAQLVLSVALTPEDGTNSMVYNNTAEVISTTNTVGRRMQYSISGNQEMANQNGDKNSQTIDQIKVKEIDADSAQKVIIEPNTGDNKTTFYIAAVTLLGAIIIACGIILIKKIVLDKRS